MDWAGYKFYEEKFRNCPGYVNKTYNSTFSPTLMLSIISKSETLGCLYTIMPTQ